MFCINRFLLRATTATVALGVFATGGNSHAAPPAQQDGLLYVCVQDDAKIAVIDMKSQSLLRIIDLTKLGFTATAKPHYIVVEPDGSNWYVSLIGANRVVKFDQNDRIVGQFEMDTPGMLALSRTTNLLAVSHSMTAVNAPPRIGMVRRSTMQGDELDVFFPRPHPMAISTKGYAYTGSLGVNQLASIALEDDKVELVRIDGPTHSLVQFAVSPDGNTLVASTDVSGLLLVFDLANPARPLLRKSIQVGAMAFDPAFSPDGSLVYVPVKSRSVVAVIETSGWTVKSEISDPAFRQPHQIVFSADGAFAFVSNNNKLDHMADPSMAGHDMAGMAGAGDGAASLAVVDTRTLRVVRSIPLGKNLTGMGTRAR
jgi:DNA-binding beta-propeller fold protein YncE